MPHPSFRPEAKLRGGVGVVRHRRFSGHAYSEQFLATLDPGKKKLQTPAKIDSQQSIFFFFNNKQSIEWPTSW
jgi:hypothetical protein